MKKEKVTVIKPQKEQKRQNDSKMLNAIISLILGIILLTDSTKAVIIVFYCIGAVFILVGAYELISYYKMKKELNVEDNNKLILGTSALFIGILIVILSGALETFERFIIGVILLFNGLRNFLFSLQTRNYVTIIVGIALIGMGLYTIFVENIVLQIVGGLLIISGIVDFVNLFINNRA